MAVGAFIPKRPFPMAYPPRKSLPHAVPPWVNSGAIYFFTQCLQDRTRTDLVQAETAPILLAAVRNYHDRQIWFMRLFLLMPDHLHALVSFPAGQSLRVAWSSWKRYTAKATSVIFSSIACGRLNRGSSGRATFARIPCAKGWRLKAVYGRGFLNHEKSRTTTGG
jgi:REP element-mobilizing transposase RayT